MAQPQKNVEQQESKVLSMDEFGQILSNLFDPERRESALVDLSKHREQLPELAPVLWYTPGCMVILVHELVNVYPALNPPTLQNAMSNRACNALALLQCIASHSDTRGPFLKANIPFFLYPFLNTFPNAEKPFEYLRLTSLGVIGALVKSDNADVVHFLLGTEVVPLCLKIMEKGTELSQTVATFVVQKILAHESGLQYVCATPERFVAVSTVLRVMVHKCTARLLRHVIRCFLRLADHERAREALKRCLPEQLRDGTFDDFLKEDAKTRESLQQLLLKVGEDSGAAIGRVKTQ